MSERWIDAYMTTAGSIGALAGLIFSMILLCSLSVWTLEFVLRSIKIYKEFIEFIMHKRSNSRKSRR